MNVAALTNTKIKHAEARKPAAIPPMPDYNARVLGYLAGAATFISGILEGHFDSYLIWFVPAAMLWPHFVYFVGRYFRRRNDPAFRQRILVIDAFIVGCTFVVLGFSLTPTLFMMLMLHFSLIIVGGMKSWLFGTLACLFGIISASIVYGIELADVTPVPVSVVSGLGTAIYVCVTAFYTHQQARALVQAKYQIQFQREQSIALSHKLAKYLSPQVWQSIFTGERDVRLETQRKKLAVFFSDIQGFTDLAEELEPESLTEILNNYFNEMSQIALKYGGTIDKFVGDSIMIFFGDPTSRGPKQDTLACVGMAIEMRKHMKILRQKWKSQGIRTPLQIRMGISTGYCTVGNFGAENRMDYTIIGKEVNLASRLESLSESGEILVSYETFSLIKDTIMCRDKGEITVKGFAKPVPIYQIIDFRRDIGGNQSFMEHEKEGFAMYLDTDKVHTQDRETVILALENAAQKLKQAD
ncbi:adenylate cyclase [Oleiphilus messinensis]|uniref:Adenylate cyclase n=1 Tax=Oleiphilus messinensis TaxID=141451 RepID=A0A1Y0I9B9_9GAMM|nr:adenylate/guanylate cyclase domain-containing protein [Oleiphilus messinensis]ARU57108.1 adenylate cyclase [Oleiphilus messinensis]